MRSPPLVTDLRFFPGGWQDFHKGLLGYLRFRVGGLLDIDGATVRRTAAGRIAISWPRRRDAHGIEHAVVKPGGAAAKAAIEAEILAELADQVSGAASLGTDAGHRPEPAAHGQPPAGACPGDCLADLARPEAHQSSRRRSAEREARG